MKWVLLSHSWPKIRRRRKGALFALISLFFGPNKKIKEEIAKVSLLLINVNGANDKTWGRDQHLMQETWGVTEDLPSAKHGKVLDVGKL